QTTGKTNTITVAKGLSAGTHTITVTKDTEAGIGYLEMVGFRCASLAALPAKPKRKLEFIGDSITCGAESDLSVAPCGTGEWFDRHNAYSSYGMATARRLNAQVHLSSRSGIGLMHSCCDMKQVMPDVWNTLDLETPARKWDTRRYQPDALMICLGQNDGEQDPQAFDVAYIAFLKTLRAAYPKTQIVCLTSPMGSENLRTYQKNALTRIVANRKSAGDSRVSTYVFSRGYNAGCGGHPDTADHAKIAAELSNYLKTTLKW
ncbi:MAG: acetyl xylan esterase, partial [Armatimonadetes bacterium]|nr:acetyl xylan esterase [Armatimonadota bacterium]